MNLILLWPWYQDLAADVRRCEMPGKVATTSGNRPEMTVVKSLEAKLQVKEEKISAMESTIAGLRATITCQWGIAEQLRSTLKTREQEPKTTTNSEAETSTNTNTHKSSDSNGSSKNIEARKMARDDATPNPGTSHDKGKMGGSVESVGTRRINSLEICGIVIFVVILYVLSDNPFFFEDVWRLVRWGHKSSDDEPLKMYRWRKEIDERLEAAATYRKRLHNAWKRAS